MKAKDGGLRRSSKNCPAMVIGCGGILVLSEEGSMFQTDGAQLSLPARADTLEKGFIQRACGGRGVCRRSSSEWGFSALVWCPGTCMG